MSYVIVLCLLLLVCSVLRIRCWLFVVCCVVFVVCCLVFGACCLLLVVWFGMRVNGCALFCRMQRIVRCSLVAVIPVAWYLVILRVSSLCVVVRCLLFVACCVLIGCCVLFIVSCLVLVVCRWLLLVACYSFDVSVLRVA